MVSVFMVSVRLGMNAAVVKRRSIQAMARVTQNGLENASARLVGFKPGDMHPVTTATINALS